MKRQKGLTLIEMMIAVAAVAIVFMATATVLAFGHKSLNQVLEYADLQRQNSHALLAISMPVKSARYAKMEDDKKSVKIYRKNDWIRFYFVQGQNDLDCHVKGQDPVTVIDGLVGDVEFEVDNTKVIIKLTLNRNNSQSHLVTTVLMRNYQEGTYDDEEDYDED